jgi:rod shape-determining protein MreC
VEKKTLRVYLLLVCISLSVLIFDGFSRIRLGNKCYCFFSLNLRGFMSRLSESNKLQEENSKLLEKIAVLSYERQLYKELKKENQELKEILEFKFNYPSALIPAEIERRTPEEINLSFQVDRGSANKIEPNAPVIGLKGIVGKVLKVSESGSIIQTLKNYNSALSVKDTRSEIRGILKWNKKFFLEGIPQYADLKEGDTLVTSGEGSVFPKGLPVGIVSYAGEKPDDYSLETEVKTFENFDKLDIIFIIKK